MDISQSQNVEGPALFVLGYHWMPLATIDSMDDIREFQV